MPLRAELLAVCGGGDSEARAGAWELASDSAVGALPAGGWDGLRPGSRTRFETVGAFHRLVPFPGWRVEVLPGNGVEDGDEGAEGGSAGHPLVVVAAAVVVGAVEAAAGDGIEEPVEEGFVAGVHSEDDVGLAAVAAEVAFADEEAEEKARGEGVGAERRVHDQECSGGGELFHRDVRRETGCALLHRNVSRGTSLRRFRLSGRLVP